MKKLYFILAALLCCFAANAADWYLCGSNLNGKSSWADAAAYKFTQSADNANEYTYEIAKISGSMKVKEAGTWNTSFGSNGKKIQEGVIYNSVKDGGDITIDGTIENATITINVVNRTILITGASKENDYSVIYLVGDFGSGWSETLTNRPLELKAGTTNVFEGTYKLTAGTSYFKLKAGNIVYGPYDDTQVTLGTPYTTNQSTLKSYVIGAGEYTFTYTMDKNAEHGTLVVTEETPYVYPDKIYCLGNVNNGGFLANNGVELPAVEGEEGLYRGNVQFTGGDSDTDSWFQFCTKLGASSNDWAGVEGRYGAKTSDQEVAYNTPMELTTFDNSFKIPNGWYTLTVNLKDKVLTVGDKGVGIETIDADASAAAEYFTLQGVRVANPTEGIYIVRNGSKARKVIIRK